MIGKSLRMLAVAAVVAGATVSAYAAEGDMKSGDMKMDAGSKPMDSKSMDDKSMGSKPIAKPHKAMMKHKTHKRHPMTHVMKKPGGPGQMGKGEAEKKS